MKNFSRFLFISLMVLSVNTYAAVAVQSPNGVNQNNGTQVPPDQLSPQFDNSSSTNTDRKNPPLIKCVGSACPAGQGVNQQ